MNHTDFKFDCCGFVSRWVFNAALNGSVDAMVWRKDTGTKYILVGSNTITSDSKFVNCRCNDGVIFCIINILRQEILSVY